MGLIDYLPDKDKREKPVALIHKEPQPVTGKDAGLAEMPVLAYKKDRESPVSPPGPITEPVKLRNRKPAGMTDEDYRAALSVFSPQRIEELYAGFDPASVEPFYEQLYRSVRHSPDIPDEQRISAARNIAGLGDALGLIAQTVAASQDSFIDIRNPDESASAKTDRNINRLKESYKKDRDLYDAGISGARSKDIEGARSAYMKDRAALLAYLAKLKKDKLEDAYRNKRFEGEMTYRYEGLKERERQNAAANQLRREKLDWDRQKGQVTRQETPKGYMDFYNASTGITYRVAEKKWKANYTQIFNRIKEDIFRQYPRLKVADKMGTLKPSEKEEYIKQYMYDNPSALNFLDNIAEIKFKDGNPESKEEAPELPEEEITELNRIASKQKDEKQALRDIARYLKNRGYDRESIEKIINTITQ